jgi:hypothetical protein
VISHLLAKALGLDTAFDKFEILVSGMDARVKCERLRKASKFMEAGPNLKARLLHFENKIIPIRNKFSHRVPALRSGSQTIHFVTTANLQEIPQRKEEEQEEAITYDSLFEHAEWLNWFAQELARALDHSALTGKLEIDHPKTTVPQAQNQSHQPKASHTIRGKPRRTRRETSSQNKNTSS